MATIEVSNNVGRVNPVIFERDGKYGVKDGERILIPAVYNQLDFFEYGYIGRRGVYYYAFSRKGIPFVTEAAGIENYGRKGVIVYKDAARETIDSIVPWMWSFMHEDIIFVHLSF